MEPCSIGDGTGGLLHAKSVFLHFEPFSVERRKREITSEGDLENGEKKLQKPGNANRSDLCCDNGGVGEANP